MILRSHPSRVRELKHKSNQSPYKQYEVAPLPGA